MTAEPPPAPDVDLPPHTVDAFHRGEFWLVQPKDNGHRSGMDALTLAAAVPGSFAGRLADFGAGAGAAGLAVASRCKQAEVVLVELTPEMAAFADATLAHPGNAQLRQRASVLVADVGLSGKARTQAGLADGSLDFVIMNPPFNPPHHRPTPDALKRQAHVMDDGLFENWIRSAAAVVRPRGGLAIIARPEQLAPILGALDGRFGKVEIVPVHPRADAAAIRVVVRAVRASRAPLALCPPLVLRDADDRLSQRADDISNGRSSLFGD
ncbi:tRNA1(Val) (adenine(37)-N6)-methyltransferase [Aminobacter aganoensis]|uniref:tRNA1(Val) A37 N6-methylase TrmN6 n=1 Tax=Aminobacter aganoensis TaxID=83264 RepID=A0A7X0KK35_9HYPH|nr:methyltransferase [Aminobacter sp. DSM 101952]KQU66806.1 methyltransferase [Aminobacter sp. DSM 101952]MBB6353652.1 tRNA1(Val) A37 N6-methylase TrmN6 [Aminobacter aganoensis]